MSQDETVAHWRQGAREALQIAQSAEEKSIYNLALFHCHMAVEKALKAAFIEEHDKEPPYTHNLSTISKKLKCVWSEEQNRDLAALTKYAVAARYDDAVWMQEEATQEKALHWIVKAQAFLSFLKT